MLAYELVARADLLYAKHLRVNDVEVKFSKIRHRRGPSLTSCATSGTSCSCRGRMSYSPLDRRSVLARTRRRTRNSQIQSRLLSKVVVDSTIAAATPSVQASKPE